MHNSTDKKGTDSTFAEQALTLIKKILKKKVWDFNYASTAQKPPASAQVNEDWVCIKMGLMIYFGNKANWSKEVYRVWREYVADKVKDEMTRESQEVQGFVQYYKK